MSRTSPNDRFARDIAERILEVASPPTGVQMFQTQTSMKRFGDALLEPMGWATNICSAEGGDVGGRFVIESDGTRVAARAHVRRLRAQALLCVNVNVAFVRAPVELRCGHRAGFNDS